MSIQPAWQRTFDFFELPVVIEPSRATLSSDAGLLPLRQFDEQTGLTQAFADALDDPRDPDLTEHSFLEMVRSRIYGILADYEDPNDHDTLRTDPVFQLIADRSPDGPDLASQPTRSRFKNAISIKSLQRLRDVFIDPFIASFETPPRWLTLDLDAIDDPAHGHQQLTFWHGSYDQNQYLPLAITCADHGQFVMLALRPGNVHAALGADDDLEYLVTRWRQVWPDVVLNVRGDAGFGVPWMYDVCERLRLLYTFGLSSNAVLQRHSDELLARAVAGWEQEQQAARCEGRPAVPQRLLVGFWYQAGSWPQPRWVIAKAEANAQGTNRRFVVTNRPGAQLVFAAAYDAYAERGESENRNKEFKCDLAMDRRERSPLRGQFLPAVPARGGHEPAGALPPPSGSAGVADTADGGWDRGRAAAALSAAAATGPVGQGAAVDLAVVVHQGGGRSSGQQPSCRDPPVVVLAAPGAVPGSL